MLPPYLCILLFSLCNNWVFLLLLIIVYIVVFRIDMKSHHLANRREEDIVYYPEGESEGSPVLSGIDISDSVVVNWKAYELISLEDIHHIDDISSLLYFKQVCEINE